MIQSIVNKVLRQARFVPGLAGFFMLLCCGGGPPAPVGPADRISKGPERSMETEAVVRAYADNSSGDVDRLEIETKEGLIWLHFPPHMARNVMDLAKKNSTVIVRYVPGRKKRPGNDENDFELRYLRSVDLHREFDLKAVPPPPPRPGKLVMIAGRPVVNDETGKAHFFILAGRRIALSPRSAETLLPVIENSSAVTVRGEERDSIDGFMSLSGLPMLRARQLSINGVNYIIE